VLHRVIHRVLLGAVTMRVTSRITQHTIYFGRNRISTVRSYSSESD
jgi:hypothetical protein